MIHMSDPLQVVVDDIRLRQLDAIRGELPDVFEGHAARLSAATATGLGILSRLAKQHPQANALVTELVGLAASDARFAFLHAIPDAPVLSMMRALALEQAAFGEATDEVAEVALLMGVFTVLLDGMLDEAPAELAPVAPWLDDVMRRQDWAEGGGVPRPPASTGSVRHSIADLTIWLAAEVIRRITAQPGWANQTVRAEFRRASLAAFAAEMRSADLRISAGATPEVRYGIVEKSTACIWAGSLVPFCVHGWPGGIEPQLLEAFARAVGTYGGWIDDTVDILVDLRGDRWSAVLLELDLGAEMLGVNGTPYQRLGHALRTPFLTRRLPNAGLDRLRTVRAALRPLTLPEETLLPALADMTYSCLTDGLVETI